MTDVDPDLLALVRRKAEGWAHDLIDLNPRTNTLFSFTAGRGAGVDLTDADALVLDKLYGGEKVRLSALVPDDDRRSGAVRQMRLLRRRIVQLDEEQGFDAGKLALGVVSEHNRARGTGLGLRAPLLLLPVSLGSTGGGDTDFFLEVTDEPEPNPILPYVLDRGFQLDADLDGLMQQMREEIGSGDTRQETMDQTFSVLAKVAEHGGVRLELQRTVALGLFSYEKFPMVQDLRRSAELLAASDVVAAVAGHEPASLRLLAADRAAALPIGDDLSPGEDFLVLDADSSQQTAIAAAGAGRHAVIVGPPGTGKSQAIANIIAVGAAMGKRVLFVAEKRAAIEAVTERLAMAGLDGLVFDLHQKKIKKREVAQQMAATLERSSRERAPSFDQLHRRLVETRRRASEHAGLLHTKVPPWDLSVFDVQVELLSRPDGPAGGPLLTAPVLERLSRPVVDGVVNDLRDYLHAGGLRVRRRESPWADAQVKDQDELRDVLSKLETVHGHGLRTSQNDLDLILRATGFVSPATLDERRQMFRLLSDVARTVDEFGPDAFAPDLDARVAATAARGTPQRELVSLGFRQRRRMRRRATELSRSGLRGGPLHLALVAAGQQRDWWLRMSNRRTGPHQVAGLADALRRFEDVRDSLAAVASCVQLPDLDRQPTPQVDATLDRLRADEDTFRQILQINRITEGLERLGLGPFLDDLATRDSAVRIDADSAVNLFEIIWYRSLERELALRFPGFREFVGARHDEVVGEFRRADDEHLRINRQRVRRAVAERLRATLDAHPEQSQLVKKEAGKKTRHLPLRSLVEKAPDVLLAAHPCWAMSPLVVSQMLPARQLFDLVVFDEASQVEPQDAVTSIMRGRQLIVAGDPRQLPPTRIFQRLVADDQAEDEEFEDDIGQYESILDALAPLLPQHLLRWHYRSRDERLIAFANQQFYGGDLVTFAGCFAESPVRLELVEGRSGPGQSGIAPAEVQRVVELAAEHARTRPEESLGVIAFGSKQSDAIEAALRGAKDAYPELADFEARHAGPGRRLFVKNLERVQGDERDAVILSVGRPKSASGKVSLHFGSLNTEGGERRLNVAITRAKRRMTVVSSFSAHEMAPNATKNKGPELLRQFLAYAGGDQRLDVIGRQREDVRLNGFERSVYDALQAQGLDVHPQWGVGEYAIDFVVAHPRQPGRMVLAVETDGERYHLTYSARDRDRLRQAHLERLGWRFIRVWSTQWFRDPGGQTARIADAWKEAVAQVDEGEIPGRPLSAEHEDTDRAEDIGTPEVRTGPCPVAAGRPAITDYTQAELVTLCEWLLSDGLLLDREQRLAQAIHQLGFQKRGSRIRASLGAALEIAYRRRDEGTL